MLIRPPQLQFFKNELKITVTDAVIIKRKLQMLNIKYFFTHFIQNVIIIITNIIYPLTSFSLGILECFISTYRCCYVQIVNFI